MIFNSDNGYHLADYSLQPGKKTPFDTVIHLPLIVVGPGVAGGSKIDEIVLNIDFALTFAELDGAAGSLRAEGRSLVGLLKGVGGAWRQMAVVEHVQTAEDPGDPDSAPARAGDPPSYGALRLPSELYVEYPSTGELGYYDLATDPYALRNVYAGLSDARKAALKQALQANLSCKGADQCWAAQSLRPGREAGRVRLMPSPRGLARLDISHSMVQIAVQVEGQ